MFFGVLGILALPKAVLETPAQKPVKVKLFMGQDTGFVAVALRIIPLRLMDEIQMICCSILTL